MNPTNDAMITTRTIPCYRIDTAHNLDDSEDIDGNKTRFHEHNGMIRRRTESSVPSSSNTTSKIHRPTTRMNH
jgi:hypothetical protein